MVFPILVSESQYSSHSRYQGVVKAHVPLRNSKFIGRCFKKQLRLPVPSIIRCDE